MTNFNIVLGDVINEVTSPVNYNVNNPITKLLSVMESSSMMAEDSSSYLSDTSQFLFPFSHLELYGPSGSNQANLDPRTEDNKTDFQKQNIKDFLLTDTFLVRGWVSAGNWTGPFLKLSYRGGPDSQLSIASGHTLGPFIYLWLKVQGKALADPIQVFYNTNTNRYEIELWGYPGVDLFDQLNTKGKDSFSKGLLVSRPDIIKGVFNDFSRDGLDNIDIYQVVPEHTMHPIIPLQLEVAWGDHSKNYWDSQQGKNYHYEFNMILRGWNNYMQVGVSANPHGGIGFLHYRNLLSNYKPYSKPDELSRTVAAWMFDADGHKNTGQPMKEEKFLSMEYVDLHILKSECSIGIHRHRDNQEIFFLLNGKAFMVTGDWYKFDNRERAFEIRTLLPGSFSLLKAGQLHSLVNALDIDATLLMFGGYD